MTEKSDDREGHLNTILARRGGYLNDPIFKSSNAGALPGGARGGGGGGDGGGGGMLKFRVDRSMSRQN